MEDEAELSDSCKEAGGRDEPGWVFGFGGWEGRVLFLCLNLLHHRRSEVRGWVLLAGSNPGFEFLVGRHDLFSVEAGLEKFPSTAHAGFDGADRGGFDLGGFGVGEVFESDEGEGAFLFGGKLVQGAIESL